MTRQEAIETLRANYPDKCYESLRNAVDMAIEALEAEPIKRGRWVRKESKRYYWFECSECGYPPPLDKFKREWFSGYCPNCGAIMDEDVTDESPTM